jgi:hypothetical protein
MNHLSVKVLFHVILTGWIVMTVTGMFRLSSRLETGIIKKHILPDKHIEGAWEGEWISDTNGHHGRLRCLVTENKDGTYTTWYHAKYKKILGFAYSVNVDATPAPQGYSFKGEADLGKLAGGHVSLRRRDFRWEF